MLPDSSVRLNKYISESGICSRREADRYIEQGNVFLNGKRATIGDQVKPGDVVKVNGQLIEPREAEDLVLIALNKPVGIVSTTEDGERDNIVDFVNHSKRVFPLGRHTLTAQSIDIKGIMRNIKSLQLCLRNSLLQVVVLKFRHLSATGTNHVMVGFIII